MSQNQPDYVQKRLEIAKLFCPLDRNAERRWARVFKKGIGAIEEKLAMISSVLHYKQQTIAGNVIIWTDPHTHVNECLFVLIPDPAQLQQVKSVFEHIEKLKTIFAYLIVHQVKDGEGTFDIFRSSQFSYLEHCNRVRVPK